MHKLIFTILILLSALSHAGEYHYEVMVCSGWQTHVRDQHGKYTNIAFSSKSDSTALSILAKLSDKGIDGSIGNQGWEGIPCPQTIILHGTLEPKVFRTKAVENGFPSEQYQEFVLKRISVCFPLVRKRLNKQNHVAYWETHFSFKTLFPKGLKIDGKTIDLDLISIKKPAEQDAWVDNPLPAASRRLNRE